MVVRTRSEWDQAMDDPTRFYFVAVGEGGRRAEIQAEAERQAMAQPARGALWLSDPGVLTDEERRRYGCDESTTAAFTLCFERHPVARFTEADLQAADLADRIDDAFQAAALHC